MSTSADIVASVCTRLRERVPSAGCQELPDDPSRWTLKNPHCELLVRYSGASYSRRGNLVDKTLSIEIYIITRALNGSSGSLAFLEAVRGALTGWSPAPGMNPMVPSRDFFAGRTAAGWQYNLIMTTSGPLVPSSRSTQ